MWSRADLKERGRNAFRRNYWKSVLVSLVLMILLSGSGSSSSGGRNLLDNNPINTIEDSELFADDYNYDDYDYNGDDYDYNGDDYDYDYDDYDYDSNDYDLYYDDGSYAGSSNEDADSDLGITNFLAMGIFGAIGIGMTLLFVAIAVSIKIFICNPIEVGGCRFFIENSYGTPGAGLLFYAFQSGYYGKIALTLFLRNLFTVLWALLLFIPGIVKAYEYRMIPYLLADNPEMDRQDAFRISKEMMNGEKMNAFILDLSFIGWNLLSAITFGLVGVFYSNPYENATDAELYLELKRQYMGTRTGYTEWY